MTQSYIISPGESTEIPRCGSFIRIDRMSITSNDSFIIEHFNQRVSVMANVSLLTSSGRRVRIEVAIGSFIIGCDFDRSVNIVLSPTDECTLSLIGAPATIQLLCTII